MEFIIDIENFCLHIGDMTPCVYNADLLQSNKRDTPENRKLILELHSLRHKYMHAMRKTDVKEQGVLQTLAQYIENVEFQLQEAWGFGRNVNFHSYWYRVPHCTCPKLDNKDSFGTAIRHINENCPVHGGENA